MPMEIICIFIITVHHIQHHNPSSMDNKTNMHHPSYLSIAIIMNLIIIIIASSSQTSSSLVNSSTVFDDAILSFLPSLLALDRIREHHHS